MKDGIDDCPLLNGLDSPFEGKRQHKGASDFYRRKRRSYSPSRCSLRVKVKRSSVSSLKNEVDDSQICVVC